MTTLKTFGRRALVPILALVTALGFGAIVIVLTDFTNLSRIGTDPVGAIGGAAGGVVAGYGAMLSGAFGDPARILAALETGNLSDIATAARPLTESLVSATPLILTGLAVAVSFRAGMFNIGVDGQLIMGALGATLAAFALEGQAPSFVILLVSVAAGVLFGAFWGFIPGVLKARTGAHEVITTIMLNYVAAQIIFLALRSDALRRPDSTAPVSRPMSGFVDVPLIFDLPAIRLDYGFVVALLMAGAVSFLLFRTTKGYELRAAGFNLTAARYAGMSAGGSMMLAMALSGALAGLGGSFLVIGTVGQLSPDLSGGIGFTAIALALLAGLRPGGVVLAALLFGALTSGGKSMGIQSGIPFDLLGFIMALVILFVAAPGLIRSIWRLKVVDPAKEAVVAHRDGADMTAVTDAVPVAAGEGLAARRATRDARIRAAILFAFGLLAFYLGSQSLNTTATFSFWVDQQGGQSIVLQSPVGVLWIVAGVISWFIALLQLLRGAAFWWRPWLLLLVWPWVAALLAAVLNGKPANLTGMIAGSLEFAVPLTLGALAGILSERSGMLNIALEGKMLVGACVASVAASVGLLLTGNDLIAVVIGITSAMLVAGGVGILLAWMGIRHKMDQIISGTVINIGAVGITNFLFLRVLSRNTELNTPPTIEPWRVPLLADVPILGPILFAAKPYVYVMYVMVAVLAYMLFRTRWGLRLRASGEKPAAAGTVGIDVISIRYRALFLAGLISGLAGSYLSLSVAGNFGMEMVAGKGFIALAAMIFGAWHPVGALGAALVFGFAGTTQTLLAILGVDVPPQLLNSVPYLVTIIVVAGVVGRVRGPAAAGQPYEQG